MFKNLLKSSVVNIDTKKLDELLKEKSKNRQFIDVRSPGEFRSKNIKGFKNIPLANIPTSTDEIDKEKEIVVICAAGARSARAAKILTKLGYENVLNVRGGMAAY